VTAPQYRVDQILIGDGRQVIRTRAGNRGKERIVPPAGDDYAFEVERWARDVEVYVSRTGRSVRVWVDGVEVVSLRTQTTSRTCHECGHVAKSDPFRVLRYHSPKERN
jgi:hypothetical protein